MAKNKGGRPSKKDTIDLKQLERLSSLGLTDKQLGFTYDVDECTINRWKKDKKVLQALKKGKEVADLMVERSLFERANGYSHPEDKIFVPTIKHYPPDTGAAIFWLKNRKPEEWREKQEIEHTMPDKFAKEFENLDNAELIIKTKQLARAVLKG